MAMESTTMIHRRGSALLAARVGRTAKGVRVLRMTVVAAAITACEVPTELPRFESTWRFPTEDIALTVAGVAGSASVIEDLTDVDVKRDVRSARIRIRPINPEGAMGVVSFTIEGGGVAVTGSVDVANPDVQTVSLSRSEVRAMLGEMITLTASGTLCRASGCGLTPPPFATVTLENELEIVVEFGGKD